MIFFKAEVSEKYRREIIGIPFDIRSYFRRDSIVGQNKPVAERYFPESFTISRFPPFNPESTSGNTFAVFDDKIFRNLEFYPFNNLIDSLV
jgi:hypothetical protein